MPAELFTEDFKPQPYWWDDAPRPTDADIALPQTADVAIIGSGFTGLNAAIETARGGRHTVVIDAETPGWGCSSRNGGQISTSIKKSYAELSAMYGEQLGFEIAREGHNALAWIADFVGRESIECNFITCGRYYGAHSRKQYDRMGRDLERPVPAGLETDAYMVPKAEQAKEIDTAFYHGGMVQPHHCSLHPARYHLGLYRVARAAGAEIVGNCRVTGLRREAAGFELETQKGAVRARQVIVATSGYTGAITPWQQHRVIPIGSYMLATEELPQDLIGRLLPTRRNIVDSRKLVVYYRTSPERKRIVFGGRVAITETDAAAAAPALHGELVRIFPELATTRMSHAWMGFVGYTFDAMPHLGVYDGIHYAMGYCGSGVSLASYFGMRIGQKVIGAAEGGSPLEQMTFPSRPYYRGNPWFLAPSIRYYRWHDRLS